MAAPPSPPGSPFFPKPSAEQKSPVGTEPKSLVARPAYFEHDPHASTEAAPYHAAAHGGLEVAPDETGLEVVAPRPGLSHNATWEKPSPLPEVTFSTKAERPPSPVRPDVDYRASSRQPDIPPASKQDRICGLSRRTFFVALAVLAFAAVAGVAIGLGLGLGLKKNTTGTATPTSATPTADSTSTTFSTSLPAPSATATLGPELNISCTENNLTLYEVPDASPAPENYLFLCGRDYSSREGAVDLFDTNTTDFVTCLESCAQQADCVAASWGNYEGTYKCWAKASLGEVNYYEGWYFAVLDAAGGG